MKAIVCSQHGTAENLGLEDQWPEPQCGPKDVIVDVKAAGLNFPDTLIIAGKYQIQPPLPFIPFGPHFIIIYILSFLKI